MRMIIFNCGILLFASLIFNCEQSSNEKIKGEVSLCQGFGSLAKKAITKPSLSIDSASYCSAERLLWEYDTMTCTLRLLHTRQIRNCASELSVEAIVIDNNITVNEIDNRDPNAGSGCDCPFDTYIEVPDVKSEQITVNYPKKSSVIKLKEGRGSIVLDSTHTEECR